GGFPLKLGPKLPVIFIDGPYSSPTEHFFEYEVGVLISAGIGTLEWFKDLIIALGEEGLGSIVEVRTYYTGKLDSVYVPEPSSDGDVFGDKVIQSAIGTTSYVGRPDFGDIFDAVGANHPNTRIGTFFCGPKPMLRKTRREAHKWDNTLRKRSNTKLDFHSEVFF
ncbi:NADPH oxidase 3, partial [Coemansia sp. RSA 2607]